MKKLLLTMGTITTVIAPVVAAVSCGDTKEDVKPIVAFKIKTLNDMRNALMPGATNIFDAHKSDSLAQINTFIDGTVALTTENKKMLKDFFARTKNVELAINLIKFGLASSDQATLGIASIAWKSTLTDQTAKTAEFLEFILNNTIEFDDVVSGVVEKFTFKDTHFIENTIKLSQLRFDETAKTIAIPAAGTIPPTNPGDPNTNSPARMMAEMGLNAMGGEDVFKFIMQKAGWTII